MRLCKREWSSREQHLILGQSCSILNTCLGACATVIQGYGVHAPAAQNVPAYALLALLFVGDCGSRKGAAEAEPLVGVSKRRRCDCVKYALLALVDVEANYMVVLAYQYTNITSIMLLDSFTIPCVMALSVAFLQAKYTARHLTGAAICLLGVACTVLSDVAPRPLGSGGLTAKDRTARGTRDALLGDALCLAGCVLYSISNVAQEKFAKERGSVRLLARLGAAGVVVAAAQAAVFERADLGALWGRPEVRLAAMAYAVAFAAFYLVTMKFLRLADAAAFNLSLLTSDAYALLFSAIFNRRVPPPLYFLALGLTTTGVVLYHSEPSPTADHPAVRLRSCSVSTADEPERGSSRDASPLHNATTPRVSTLA